MSALAEFHDLLLPELPGCTVAMVNLHLRETAREFCRRTAAWRQALTAINTVGGQASYVMTLPSDSQLVRVTDLTVHGRRLWRSVEIDKADAGAQQPKYGITDPPFDLNDNLTQITLHADEVPAESVAGGLLVSASLTPTATAATLPDFLLGQYSEALRHGTLARLMLMPKKPWTDRALAGAYEGLWQEALNFAAYQAQVGNTRRPLRVKPY
jgi:hypothetical protein